MTRVSFIMPTFNRASYIEESILSITKQMGADDELIIVDDGSTDDTSRIVQGLNVPLRYIRQTNAGKSVALNRGIAMTDGKFVWICDDDDLLLPGAVDDLVAQITNGPAKMVFGRYTRFRMDGNQKVDMGVGYWPDLSSGTLTRHILEDSFVMHNAALVARSAYLEAGPFDPAMLRSQDYEMFVRLSLQTPSLFVDRLIFEQRKHDGARGPQTILHKADTSGQVWEKFDQIIFRKLYREVGLEFFDGLVSGSDPKLVRRAALLQRGCIMGRHGLWNDALNDFEAALLIAPNIKLASLETSIGRRVTQGKHGFRGLVTPISLERLELIRSSSVNGRALAVSITNGMIWQLRGQNPERRSQAMAILGQKGGLRYGVPIMLARLTGKSSSCGRGDLKDAEKPRYICDDVRQALMPSVEKTSATIEKLV